MSSKKSRWTRIWIKEGLIEAASMPSRKRPLDEDSDTDDESPAKHAAGDVEYLAVAEEHLYSEAHPEIKCAQYEEEIQTLTEELPEPEFISEGAEEVPVVVCQRCETSANVQAEQNAAALARIEEKLLTLQQDMHQIFKALNITKMYCPKLEHLFPVRTLENMSIMEEKLLDPEFSNEMEFYLSKYRTHGFKIGQTLSTLISDEVLINFNWNGVHQKRSVKDLKLCKLFKQSCAPDTPMHIFSGVIRSAIRLAHNRYNLKRKKV